MKIRRLFTGRATASVLACLLLVGVSHVVVAELQRVYVIVNHADAPITITGFGKYRNEDDTHISSVIEYTNATSRDIEALAITMIYFDAFNEREDGVKGISTDALPARQQDTGAWSTYGNPGFVKTAMAFVSAVRFLDGEVWHADMEDVLQEAALLPGLSFLSQTEMLEIEKD
ncbi:MAG: hypothetical protein WBC63_06630 [Candidatus Bipolaricaulia bacterium]